MRKLLRNLIDWVMQGEKDGRLRTYPLGLVDSSDHDTRAKFKIGVVSATNGRLLEISTYKHNPNGSDWTNELFIVPDDQTLAQSITTILTLKGLNQ
jgi:hypothetical protein